MQADLVLDLVHRLLIVKLHSDSLFSKWLSYCIAL